MIPNLKPYPACKPSGVPWIRCVPAHWEVAMVKQNYAIQLGKMLQTRPNSPADVEIPYLKAQHVQWFHVRTTDPPKMWASQHDIDQFGVASGDLLVCEGGEGGRCGILKQEADGYIIQNALHRVRPREQSRNDYLQYVMSSIAATGWFDALNNKATIAHFTSEKFGSLKVPIPPLPEQTAIVRFLDYADQRIRRYIRAKQKLIALLEEQKQGIIHQAVTGQIDVRTDQPYPAYKPSGIEWLGDVPAHWNTAKIKSLTRPGYKTFVDGDWIESPYITPDGIRLIQTGNIGIGEYKEKGFRYISEETFRSFGCTEIMLGDVLICRLGEPVSRACIAPNLGGRMITSVDVCILKLSDEVNAQFLVYSMSSRYYLDWVGSLVRGSTRDRVSRSMLGSFSVPFPPLAEQTAIARYLDKATADIDTDIFRAHRQIELLQEYRTRLIADVVTGKLDVRETATALPDTDPLAADDALETPATQTPPRSDACVAPTGRSHAAPEALPTGQ